MKYSNFLSFDLIRSALPGGDVPYAVRLFALKNYFAGISPDPGAEKALHEALRWVCLAQDCSASDDGGVARHFSLVDGWGPSYPETTGYIVPTLINAGQRLDVLDLIPRARRMLDWLLSIQNSDGSFNGGTVFSRPQTPVLFNTGQILIGLAAGAQQIDNKYRKHTIEAANWMLQAQEPDGSWQLFSSPFAASGLHTYDTHAAIGLLDAAAACADDRYAEAAIRNIDWAISKQRPNGWFDDCCVTNSQQPLTHTIGYTIRGILAAYKVSQDKVHLAAARLALDSLLKCLRADGSLAGRYNCRWEERSHWTCVTGNLQIAECWLLAYDATGIAAYRNAAARANRFARQLLNIGGPAERAGAIPGSYPLGGEYTPFEYPNWAAKFFIDSQLMELSVVADAG